MPDGFTTQVVSDVERGGVGIELVPLGGVAIAGVFRNDVNRTLSVQTFGAVVPAGALLALLGRARVKLGPFEDSTPLSGAGLGRD
jgi:hypothetical protein